MVRSFLGGAALCVVSVTVLSGPAFANKPSGNSHPAPAVSHSSAPPASGGRTFSPANGGRTFSPAGGARSFSPGGTGGARGFSPGGSGRTFSSGGTGAHGTSRTFGSTHAGASSTRSFGANHQVGAPGHIVAPADRRFGDRSFGDRSFGDHHAGPRRAAGGGHYFYRCHSFARFRAGYYHWPHGFHYVHYGVGAFFPRAFWIRDYYISDYVGYGLDPPPPDFVWVRYGPDLVLFNDDTGEIAQVVPGAFDEAADADAPGPDDAPPPPGGYQ